MPETQDNPHLDKAQQDKERFLESKKGLLPEFEFPQDETKPDKEYSKETLWADTIEERLESVKELMDDPDLITKAIKDLKSDADTGRQGGKSSAAFAFRTYSNLLESGALTPEQITELKETMYNPELLTNAIKNLKTNTDSASQGNQASAAFAFRTYSALLTTQENLRQEGRKIDETKFAQEALEPDKSIPPRPEMRSY